MWQAIDDPRGEALARTALGGAYSITGEKRLALNAHADAMKTLRRLGDHLGEAAALNGSAEHTKILVRIVSRSTITSRRDAYMARLERPITKLFPIIMLEESIVRLEMSPRLSNPLTTASLYS